jgi:hypothetical protein
MRTALLLLAAVASPKSRGGVRITRGPMGAFAGDNFPCAEQDAHRGASWARGACLIKCRRAAGPSARCGRAFALCRKLPHCSGINVNVEGTVATLKKATALCGG